MKRGKDDEKITGPMFPRLHVNDADKGGPRAPPRNKMALYEQLSIPSQRSSHSNGQRNLNQGVPNSKQVLHGHQTDKHYSPYSGMNPLPQVEQRKKLPDDDYTVPIFTHHGTGKEFDRSSNDMDSGKISSSNLSYLNHSLKFQKAKETEHSRQDGRKQSAENAQDFAGAQVKALPVSSQKIDAQGSNHPNGVDKTKAGSNLRAEVVDVSQPSAERQNISAVAKRNPSILDKVLHLENKSSFVHHFDDMESSEEEVCGSFQNGILEAGDSVSETSILDSVSGHDITADDIVAIIGQKHFWKARKAIANQQRVYAVQVFELHRLIKVQKLIAASRRLLLQDATYLGKALKSLPGRKLPLDYNPAAKELVSIPKPKADLENTSNSRKEISIENSFKKPSVSSAQSGPLLSSHRPLNVDDKPTTPSLNSEPSATQWYVNQPQGHQWLIPVMSPSEGLVYKPYHAPGVMNQDCNNGYGPPNPFPMVGSFPAPAYGIPAQPHQYQFPPYPPHGYFHPYGMPVMNSTTFSGSTVDQIPPRSRVPPKEANCSNQSGPPTLSDLPNQRNERFQDYSNRRTDAEVRGSTESTPSERHRCGSNRSSRRADSSIENRNVLPLFPALQEQQPKPTSRVIKVVPHNATSLSESVARIIQSIEEERKKQDSLIQRNCFGNTELRL